MSVVDDPEKNELFETLLWLRKHYDEQVQADLAVKERVLRRVDQTIDKFLPPGFSWQQWLAVINHAFSGGLP